MNNNTMNTGVSDKKSEVSMEILDMQVNVSQIQSFVGDLADRLQVVLKSNVKESAPGPLSPSPILTPLASELHSQNSRLCDIKDMISSIIYRLEI